MREKKLNIVSNFFLARILHILREYLFLLSSYTIGDNKKEKMYICHTNFYLFIWITSNENELVQTSVTICDKKNV